MTKEEEFGTLTGLQSEVPESKAAPKKDPTKSEGHI